MAKPRCQLKVCCIASVEEARLAVELGADHLGLVSAMPSGPGVISDERIAEIAAGAPEHIGTFLLTSLFDAEAILSQLRLTGANHVQLVDRVAPGAHAAIRRAFPAVRIVQVVHVTGPAAIEEAREAAPWVDLILLDSGNPALAVKELGGTGRTHDWGLSRRIVETCGKPVFLAGGMESGNVSAALQSVGPHGIDVCSGVRTNGALDARKLRALVTAMGA